MNSPISTPRNQHMHHAMLDIETLGNGPSAAIVAIGAVQFGWQSGLGDEFYARICPRSAVGSGGKMDVDTVMWWLKQSDAARAQLTERWLDSAGDQYMICDALQLFSTWLTGRGITDVWGNGADFDNVILSGAYSRCNIRRPWPYWGNRCYRTVKNLRPDIELQREGTAHHALDDARHQARHLLKLGEALRLGKVAA